jgi:hypothetical protein
MFLRARTIRSGDLLTVGKKMKEELQAWRVSKKRMAPQLVYQLHRVGLHARAGMQPGMAIKKKHGGVIPALISRCQPAKRPSPFLALAHQTCAQKSKCPLIA